MTFILELFHDRTWVTLLVIVIILWIAFVYSLSLWALSWNWSWMDTLMGIFVGAGIMWLLTILAGKDKA